jgi:hypothetical protein
VSLRSACSAIRSRLVRIDGKRRVPPVHTNEVAATRRSANGAAVDAHRARLPERQLPRRSRRGWAQLGTIRLRSGWLVQRGARRPRATGPSPGWWGERWARARSPIAPNRRQTAPSERPSSCANRAGLSAWCRRSSSSSPRLHRRPSGAPAPLRAVGLRAAMRACGSLPGSDRAAGPHPRACSRGLSAASGAGRRLCSSAARS